MNVLILLQRNAENRSESIKEKLEEEISELEERKDELVQLSQIGDDLRFLQVCYDSPASFSYNNRIIADWRFGVGCKTCLPFGVRQFLRTK